MPESNIYRAVAERIISSSYVIAFTGAGVSAESGIPTFRDKGGLWEKYPVDVFGTPQGLLGVLFESPSTLADFISSSVEVLGRAKPNQGHIALGELEKMGMLKAVITQNIDNLHQEGGNKNVIEVHGTITRLRCILCGKRQKLAKEEAIEKAKEFSDKLREIDLSDILSSFSVLTPSEILQRIKERFGDSIPLCECGGIMRPDVVFFTEAVQDMDIAFREAEKADMCIVAGTSGVVYPAAYIPHIVKNKNGFVVEINPTVSSFPSDIYIKEGFASAMPKILEEIKKLVS